MNALPPHIVKLIAKYLAAEPNDALESLAMTCRRFSRLCKQWHPWRSWFLWQSNVKTYRFASRSDLYVDITPVRHGGGFRWLVQDQLSTGPHCLHQDGRVYLTIYSGWSRQVASMLITMPFGKQTLDFDLDLQGSTLAIAVPECVSYSELEGNIEIIKA
jgi:hypothetical protein